MNKLIAEYKDRVFAFLIITLIEYSSAKLLIFVPRNDLYFLTCGLFNFLTLLILTGYKDTNLIVDLAILVSSQLFFQFLGWILYSLYFKPYLYNLGVHIFVIATYVRIILIGEDDGDITSRTDWAIFCGNAIGRSSNYNEVCKC